MKKKILTLFILSVFLLTTFSIIQTKNVYAEGDTGAGTIDPTGDTAGTGTIDPTGGDTGSGDFSLDITIDNPLKTEIDTLPEFVEEVLRIVLKVGIPIVTLFIIYAGLLFVMAAGNPEKLKKAKETLLWTLVGAAVLLGAWVIAEAIQGTLTQLGA